MCALLLWAVCTFKLPPLVTQETMPPYPHSELFYVCLFIAEVLDFSVILIVGVVGL